MLQSQPSTSSIFPNQRQPGTTSGEQNNPLIPYLVLSTVPNQQSNRSIMRRRSQSEPNRHTNTCSQSGQDNFSRQPEMPYSICPNPAPHDANQCDYCQILANPVNLTATPNYADVVPNQSELQRWFNAGLPEGYGNTTSTTSGTAVTDGVDTTGRLRASFPTSCYMGAFPNDHDLERWFNAGLPEELQNEYVNAVRVRPDQNIVQVCKDLAAPPPQSSNLQGTNNRTNLFRASFPSHYYAGALPSDSELQRWFNAGLPEEYQRNPNASPTGGVSSNANANQIVASQQNVCADVNGAGGNVEGAIVCVDAGANALPDAATGAGVQGATQRTGRKPAINPGYIERINALRNARCDDSANYNEQELVPLNLREILRVQGHDQDRQAGIRGTQNVLYRSLNYPSESEEPRANNAPSQRQLVAQQPCPQTRHYPSPPISPPRPFERTPPYLDDGMFIQNFDVHNLVNKNRIQPQPQSFGQAPPSLNSRFFDTYVNEDVQMSLPHGKIRQILDEQPLYLDPRQQKFVYRQALLRALPGDKEYFKQGYYGPNRCPPDYYLRSNETISPFEPPFYSSLPPPPSPPKAQATPTQATPTQIGPAPVQIAPVQSHTSCVQSPSTTGLNAAAQSKTRRQQQQYQQSGMLQPQQHSCATSPAMTISAPISKSLSQPSVCPPQTQAQQPCTVQIPPGNRIPHPYDFPPAPPHMQSDRQPTICPIAGNTSLHANRSMQFRTSTPEDRFNKRIKDLQFQKLVLDEFCPGVIQATLNGTENFNDYAFELVFAGILPAKPKPIDPITIIEAIHLRIEHERNECMKKNESADSALNTQDIDAFFQPKHKTDLNNALCAFLKAEAVYRSLHPQSQEDIAADVNKTEMNLFGLPINLTAYTGTTTSKTHE